MAKYKARYSHRTYNSSETTDILKNEILIGEDGKTIYIGKESNQINKLTSDITSQGRASKYYINKSGWYRILNLIRASNGVLTIGLAQNNRNNSGRSTQAIGFDFTGYVWYSANDNPDSGAPEIILKYNNIFADKNTIPAEIKAIRIGYTKGNNPINCVLDVYISISPLAENCTQGDATQINVNYAGFSDSHLTSLITEPQIPTDTVTIDERPYGLKYYTMTVNNCKKYLTDKTYVNYTTEKSFGEKINNSNILNLSPINSFERQPKYNLLYRKGECNESTGYENTKDGTIVYNSKGYYILNANASYYNPLFNTKDTGRENNLLNWFIPPSNICSNYSSDVNVASPLILNEGKYFISEGTGLLIKNGNTVNFGQDGGTQYRVRVNRTDSKIFEVKGKMAIMGIRLTLNSNKVLKDKIITPMLIKKEGIFSDLANIDYDNQKEPTMIIFKNSEGSEIIRLPIEELIPQNYDDLIDTTKFSPEDTLQYKPMLNDNGEIPLEENHIIYENGGNFIVNSEAPKAIIKYYTIQQNLPVIVSDTQPDPDQPVIWIKPSDIT